MHQAILTFQSLTIILCTTSFDMQKFCMVLAIALMCCVRTSEQTATFTSYCTNRLVLYNRGGQCLLRGTR